MHDLRTGKVCCFGELLLRFALSEQWTSSQEISYHVGGAELNVATALAKWAVDTSYVTVLPDNFMSKELTQHIDKLGISISDIIYGGKKLGIYYLPEGKDVKSHGVIYDRDFSSFSMIKPGSIDWDAVFEGCEWFHFSAISPALNPNIALVCHEAVQAAHEKGLKISIDLNYRNKLWKYGVQPFEIMPELVKFCDVIMGNMWSAESLLGVKSPIANSKGLSDSDITSGAQESIRRIKEYFPKADAIAFTHRLPDKYWGVLNYNGKFFNSEIYPVSNTSGVVGSGDCFMAGLIYTISKNYEPTAIINFAASAAVGKLAEHSDATKQSVEDIKVKMYHGAQ